MLWAKRHLAEEKIGKQTPDQVGGLELLKKTYIKFLEKLLKVQIMFSANTRSN